MRPTHKWPRGKGESSVVPPEGAMAEVGASFASCVELKGANVLANATLRVPLGGDDHRLALAVVSCFVDRPFV